MANAEFSIIDATVILNRVDGTSLQVDISSQIMEFEIFEHLSKPYLDARLVFIDDFGFRDTLSVQGSEQIVITVGDPEEPDKPIFTKAFFFAKVNDTKKINERAELLSLDLIEDHVLISAVKQFSRSYRGTFEDMIAEIALSELFRGTERKVVKDKFDEGTAQGTRKVVVPYMSPLEAIQWIKDRATTRSGGPIYLRSSLYTNDLLLSDFDSLMREEAVNLKAPMRYSSASASIDQGDDALRPYFEIASYAERDNADMLRLYEDGAVGSFYTTIDAGKGTTLGDHISVRDIIDEMYTLDILSKDQSQSIFDPALLIGDKLSDEYDSLNIFQVTSSGTYNQFESYHDEAQLLDQANNLVESKLKVKNKIIRMIMTKNLLDIGIDAKVLLEGRIESGSKLRLLFLSPNVSADEKDQSEQIDRRKSGDYMILAVNHRFLEGGHSAVLRLTKLGELPKNFTL